MRPFSTYPKDRAMLKALALTIQETPDMAEAERAADMLSDLVLAILSDEDVVISESEPTPDDR